MLGSLKEKLEKILCFFGLHDHEHYSKEGYITFTRCKRPDCGWHSTELKIPDPPPRPHGEELREPLWENDLKMYVLIREDTPPDIVPLIAAHTAMGTYKKFANELVTKKWFETKLQKTVICTVTPLQFEEAKRSGAYFTLTEVHHLELGELGLGINVRRTYPKFFKFLRLYKVQKNACPNKEK